MTRFRHYQISVLVTLLFLGAVSLVAEEKLPLEVPSSSPLVAPERSLALPIHDSAFGEQTNPRIATSGSMSLAVWVDIRAGGYEIYGARLDSEANLLDSSGIFIAGGRESTHSPQVVWNGRSFVVSWSEWGATGGVFVATVSEQGQVSTSRRVASPSANTSYWAPLLASNGTTSLLVVSGNESNSPANWYLLDSETVLISQGAFRLSERQLIASVASNGDDYIVASVNFATDSIQTARMKSGGEFEHQGTIQLTPSGYGSVVAMEWSGAEFLVVFSDAGKIKVFRLDRDGKPLTSVSIIFDNGTLRSLFPAVAWLGDQYLVTFMLEVGRIGCFPACDPGVYDVLAIRVDGEGNVISRAPITISREEGSQRLPRLVSASSGALVVWSNDTNGDILGTVVRGDDTTRQLLVSRSAAKQRDATVASSRRIHLAAWMETRNRDYFEVVAGRLTPEGQPLDGPGIKLFGPFYSPVDGQPKVASDGENFLVIWKHESRIVGRRVSSAGTLLEDEPFIIQSPANLYDSNLVLVYDGTQYVAFWLSGDVLQAKGISPHGLILDPSPLNLGLLEGLVRDLVVNSEGKNHLLAWSIRTSDPMNFDVRAAILPKSLTGISAQILLSTAWMQSSAPAIAHSGTSYFIAWASGTAGTFVRGVTLSLDGQILDPPQTLSQYLDGNGLGQSDNATRPCVVWDGQKFLAHWTESRGSTNEVVAAAIDAGGTTGRVTGVTLFRGRTDEQLVGAIRAGSSGVLIIYARTAREPEYGGVRRLFSRTVGAPFRSRLARRE